MSDHAPHSTQPIRFFHRGEFVELHGQPPTRSVLNWLREDAHCSGTKEGCNEGDCGACTVMVADLAEPGDASAVRGLNLRTVNACIQFLPTLHGKALFTVEDLPQPAPCPATLAAGERPEQHPVQQALVACHGSQCGFCTPGFVMSLWEVYERHPMAAPDGLRGPRPSTAQLADALSGNLCRCTGYRPILDAGHHMFELPALKLDTAPIVAALQTLREQTTGDFHTTGRNAFAPGGARLDGFHAPATLKALAELRAAQPDARLLAGATDVGLWVNKQFRDVGELIWVGRVAELQTIEEKDGALWIGAGATLEAAWAALAERAPSLREVWKRFASPPIRHAGTLGGNVANGSPIGDGPPVLMALGAELLLRHGSATRRVPLDTFYTGYQRNLLQPGEFIQAIAVPLSAFQTTLRVGKISKRFDSDISALCAAFSFTLSADGTLTAPRLALGGMAATVQRATHAEAALAGQPWTQATVHAAQAALTQDFTPLSDLRASADYRMQVARNLLQRWWLDTRADAPLPPQALSVWAPARAQELLP
jgi:xanthine dehydrogenase small subunit